MCSPIGYTSFATLWKRFTREHFAKIYSLAAKDYAGPNAERSYKIGSPADISEHIFLKSLCDQPVVLASNSAGISKVEIELDRQVNSIYTVNTPFESVLTVSELRKGGVEQDVLHRFGSIRFAPFEHEYNDQAAWAKNYPEVDGERQIDLNIEQTPFHTLPFF
ncbi:MAG: hypothetical protein OXC60_00005 [Litoreibacter sp.]|nr:hypothetical protein [Litoreibacter sp.]